MDDNKLVNEESNEELIKESNVKEKKKLIKLSQIIFTICYFICLSFLCCYSKDILHKDTIKEVIGIISDCFILPGLLYVCLAAFCLVAKTGFFDAIAYGCKLFITSFAPGKKALKKRQTYYEFKQQKAEKGRKSYPFFIIFGGIMIGIGIIIDIVYLCL